VRALGRSLKQTWSERRPYQAFAFAVGLLLMVSGLFHLGVFLVNGGPWKGPVSWRKPITFGLSFGLTTLTLAWLSICMRKRRGVAGAITTLAVASLLEVFLVALQRWRNVPSHFNDATPFDSAVFGAMGTSVAVIVLCIIALTVVSFRELNADRAMALAMRAGLLLLLVGQALGLAIIFNGTALDMAPTETDLAIFGNAGVMKLPHAVTMHAIQVLPILALFLSLTALPEPARRRVVWVATAGYVGVAGTTALQTFSGLAPFDLTAPAAGLVIVSVALLFVALLRVMNGLRDSWFGGSAAGLSLGSRP
jgi:hypothetical protein